MSNDSALELYERVISAVIEESRQDFDDCGVDEATLVELGTLWREKLQQTQKFKQAQHQTQVDELVQFGSKTDHENTNNNNNSNISDNIKKEESADTQLSATGSSRTIRQVDMDDEEIHESDDEDEDEEDEDEDEDEGDVILCLYERVQRVRNRWKCQLREGMATLQGRDYVFAKASGDSEW